MKTTNRKKQKKLAIKLTVRITAAMLAVFALMILAITSSTKNDLAKRELDTLELLARENSNLASQSMETMLDKQQAVISTIRIIDTMEPAKREEFLSKLLDSVGQEEESILTFFYAAEPNTLLPNTPDGYSIHTSSSGIQTLEDRYYLLDKSTYDAAAKAKITIVADPAAKNIDGKTYTVLTIYMPVLDGAGSVIGMIGADIDLNILIKASYNTGGYETFNNEIICGHKTMIYNSRNIDLSGKPYTEVSSSKNPERILQAAADAQPLTLLDTSADGAPTYRAYVPFHVGNSAAAWLSGTSISKAELDKQINSQILLMSLFSTLGLITIILFSYFAIRRILKPLKELETVSGQLAEGNLHIKISHRSNDEMGRLAESFNNSIATISSYVQDIDTAMGEMSRGNFDVYPAQPFKGDFVGIERSISNFIQNMCSTLSQINLTSDFVASGAEQVALGSTDLSQGATEQSLAIEELTSTISDLSVKVKQNDKNARLAVVRVKEADQQIEASNARMEDMMTAMTEITNNSSQIEKIIKTIEDIAFQTNILALNAAVEAARAGESGKGFAIVAEEVRSLASKSAEAAKNTTAMIQSSIVSVKNGSLIASEAAQSLGAVREKAAAAVTIVDEICRASLMQLEQIEQISSSADQVSGVVQTNTATSQESAASSEELSSQAQLLKSLVDKFKLNKALSNPPPGPLQ